MRKKKTYQPPFTMTPAILKQVVEIGEAMGRYSALSDTLMSPSLRRKNRIRTIQASLAIENNTLTLEQVTALIHGKRVLGHPREIQEVHNAFATYEHMKNWNPTSRKDLLAAHGMLLAGLVDDAGCFRTGGVGIFRGKELVHMAPPYTKVPELIKDLLLWLKKTDAHPLIASCIFHYELEFIHPFADGNGRMGRLWQTLILRQWRSLFAYLPVETIIKKHQDQYYQVLAEADDQAESTPFVAFMLNTLFDAIIEATDPVSDPVSEVIEALFSGELGISDLMARIGLSHRPTFRKNYLNPALDGGWVERTLPETPSSPKQQYRLTEKGRVRVNLHGRET